MGLIRTEMTDLTDTAVILVAGIGSRLRPLTDQIPKALVSVGQMSILERAVSILRRQGVTNFVFATGYRQEAVMAKVAEWNLRATFCENEAYDSTQNSISLLKCAGALQGRGFYKLDGDVLFEEEVIARLAAAEVGLAVAVDGKRALDEEAMKVQLGDNGKIAHFGKAIRVKDAAGESIGIERLSASVGAQVLAAIDDLMCAGLFDRYYEDVYATLIAQGKIEAHAVEVGDLPWTEVDNLEDLARANELFSARAG